MSSPEAPDLARLLLGKARQDALAASKLVPDEEVGDAIVGFHAQQAVEKAVKAVLAAHEVTFPFVHDIDRLVSLLSGAGVAPPPAADEAIELSPWAAEMRYGEILEEPLDRSSAVELVENILAWAANEVESARS